MSCANDDDEARVRPATTARIVAKATAEIVASRIAPQAESTPPRCRASSGAAVLPAGLDATISSLADQGRRAEAERDGHQVEAADDADRPVHGLPRGLGVGTV
jgi:hypothetical protein